MSAGEIFVSVLRALKEALDAANAPFMVIGGIAVIAQGIARATVDVDALVWGPAVDLGSLLDTLGEHSVQPRVPDARQFARDHQVLLLEHRTTKTPIDLSLAWLPFEREALTRAVMVDFQGVVIPVATPEDLVIQKAVAFRFRDRDDIERLLLVHGEAINLERVRGIVAEFAEVLDDPQRLEGLEQLIRRSQA